MEVLEKEELPRVMREIAEAMGGMGAALTLHPEGDRPPSVIYADREHGISTDMVERLLQDGTLSLEGGSDGGFGWIAGDNHPAIILPVQRVRGHSPLAITVFFDGMTSESRKEAEAVYLRRRPFAVGYFRLWQTDRARARRIEALEAALDLSALSVILLDLSGTVIFANQAARAILKAGDGLRERGGHIYASALADATRLQVAIDHVLGGSDRRSVRRAPMLTIRRRNGSSLVVSILPNTRAAEEPGDVAVMIFAVDPDSDTEQLLEPICKLFRLSHVETRLACQLAGGATLSDAAHALNLKEQTARGYLKQVFLKTGTNRQSDLVRTMLSNLVRTTQAIPSEVI